MVPKAIRIAQFLALGYSNFGWRGHAANARSFTPGALDVDLSGRHIVVTGATSGLGRSAAVALAARSATVHLVVRDTVRGQALADELAASGGHAVVHRCDLSSLAEVDALVRELDGGHVPVTVLINNAGGMVHCRMDSPDGYEMGFATNTLGTFALTEGLRPVLQRAARDCGVRARVVTVSSAGMLTEQLEVDDLEGDSLLRGGKKAAPKAEAWAEGQQEEEEEEARQRIDGEAQYARCKRRQVALTEHWARRYKDDNILWVSMHPGWASTPGLEKAMPEFYRVTKSQLRNDEQGADTIVYLAAADEVGRFESGEFFFDRKEAKKHLWLSGTEYEEADVERLATQLADMVAKAGYPIPE